MLREAIREHAERRDGLFILTALTVFACGCEARNDVEAEDSHQEGHGLTEGLQTIFCRIFCIFLNLYEEANLKLAPSTLFVAHLR